MDSEQLTSDERNAIVLTARCKQNFSEVAAIMLLGKPEQAEQLYERAKLKLQHLARKKHTASAQQILQCEDPRAIYVLQAVLASLATHSLPVFTVTIDREVSYKVAADWEDIVTALEHLQGRDCVRVCELDKFQRWAITVEGYKILQQLGVLQPL